MPVTFPSSVGIGDLVLVFPVSRGTNAAGHAKVTVPGYNELPEGNAQVSFSPASSASRRCYMFWNINTELSPEVFVEPTEAADIAHLSALVVLVKSGTFNPTAPINAIIGWYKVESGTVHEIESATTTVGNCLTIGYDSHSGSINSEPSGWTVVRNSTYTGTVWSREQAEAGATPTGSIGFAAAQSGGLVTLAIAPLEEAATNTLGMIV